jgi:hypothetical protein
MSQAPTTNPMSIQSLVTAVVEGLKTPFQNLANGIIGGFKGADRDIEHRMYEQASLASALYALEHMVTAKPFRARKYGGGGRFDLLEYALSLCTVDGFYGEFGVYKGETLTFMADRIDKVAYGFDSFEGLPADWFLGVGQGYFSLQGQMPDLKARQQNVRLVKGWFNESVPEFAAQIDGPAAFLHIDCDLYESTKTIFDGLADRIVPGTVILFDEYLNYPGWQNHEVKAFREFCEAHKVRYRYVGFAPTMFSVAVVVESVG